LFTITPDTVFRGKEVEKRTEKGERDSGGNKGRISGGKRISPAVGGYQAERRRNQFIAMEGPSVGALGGDLLYAGYIYRSRGRRPSEGDFPDSAGVGRPLKDVLAARKKRGLLRDTLH